MADVNLELVEIVKWCVVVVSGSRSEREREDLELERR